MTAIEDDLTRALAPHRGCHPEYIDYEWRWSCTWEPVTLTDWDRGAHLVAVLAPIVAAHVAAGQEQMRVERDRLAKWKAEAMPVLDGLQELGQALGIGLGKRITGREAVDAALDLRNERDAARAAMKTTTKETS